MKTNTFRIITVLLIVSVFTLCSCSQAPQSSTRILPELGQSSSSSTAAGTQNPVSSQVASSVPQTYKLVIPEGFTLPRIGMKLEELGVCTADEFVAAAQDGDYSEFSLIAAQEENPNRCFTLEGYLFPATYDIYTGSSPEQIIRKLLRTTEERLAPYMQQIAESGYTVDEIITMASIIEKEAYGPPEMHNIASVLHNRLSAGMQLQCDVTINYVEGAIKPFITGDENRYNEHYNTYKCPALPAGAICNPSSAAILAALQPAQTNYLYFLCDENNVFYYAETYDGHLANIELAGI